MEGVWSRIVGFWAGEFVGGGGGGTFESHWQEKCILLVNVLMARELAGN